MIEESGLVVAIRGDEACVETSRKSSCGSCEAKGCGTGALSKVLGNKSQQMWVKNPVSARPGDQVVLGISETALVKGSLAVYLIPLLALFAGGMLGEMLGRGMGFAGETVSILMALAGLGASLFWLRHFNRRVADDERFNAVIVRTENATPLAEKIYPNLHK